MAERPDTAKRRSARRRGISIQDVADAASVSIATVSRALNRPELVSPETAQRIRAVVDDLGYRPNRFAQGLMTQRSGLLGIALPDIHGEFYSELMRGADAEARRLGYHLLISSTALDSQPQGPAGGALTRAFGLIDGLCAMITEPCPEAWSEMRQLGIPLVAIDTELDPDADTIIVDQEPGSTQACEHLLASTPPERCSFVGGPEQNFDTRARASVFIKALRQAGHTPRPDQVAFGTYSTQWGRSWARDHLRPPPADQIAVFAGNDEIALGILSVAHELGVAVPDRLRLVGFDDTTLGAAVYPALSSVRAPRDAVGRAAIRALVARIEEPDTLRQRVSITTELVIRQSS